MPESVVMAEENYSDPKLLDPRVYNTPWKMSISSSMDCSTAEDKSGTLFDKDNSIPNSMHNSRLLAEPFPVDYGPGKSSYLPNDSKLCDSQILIGPWKMNIANSLMQREVDTETLIKTKPTETAEMPTRERHLPPLILRKNIAFDPEHLDGELPKRLEHSNVNIQNRAYHDPIPKIQSQISIEFNVERVHSLKARPLGKQISFEPMDSQMLPVRISIEPMNDSNSVSLELSELKMGENLSRKSGGSRGRSSSIANPELRLSRVQNASGFYTDKAQSNADVYKQFEKLRLP
jgi:hypothetical protein